MFNDGGQGFLFLSNFCDLCFFLFPYLRFSKMFWLKSSIFPKSVDTTLRNYVLHTSYWYFLGDFVLVTLKLVKFHQNRLCRFLENRIFSYGSSYPQIFNHPQK